MHAVPTQWEVEVRFSPTPTKRFRTCRAGTHHQPKRGHNVNDCRCEKARSIQSKLPCVLKTTAVITAPTPTKIDKKYQDKRRSRSRHRASIESNSCAMRLLHASTLACSSFPRRAHLLPHVAVLVLLARTAGAWVVAADAVGRVADRLDLLRRSLEFVDMPLSLPSAGARNRSVLPADKRSPPQPRIRPLLPCGRRRR